MHAVDSGKITILVLLDNSVSFDTVDHNILLSVLCSRVSIKDTTYVLFQSYLLNHQQSFVHDDQQTVFFLLLCSVPQGPLLGPLEFITCTEDIFYVVAKHDSNQLANADDNELQTSCFQVRSLVLGSVYPIALPTSQCGAHSDVFN